jgi:hypothetical protein
LGTDALLKVSEAQFNTYYRRPLEIRAHEIALKFLEDGRFDTVEQKFYVIDTPPKINHIVMLDCDLAPEHLQAAGELWGKHETQWQAGKRAMELLDWQYPNYSSHGWRWTKDDYKNSDNPFLQWISRTSTGCDIVNFKRSGTRSHRNTDYWLLYV